MKITTSDIIRYDISSIPDDYALVDKHARKRIQQFYDKEANQISKVYDDWRERVENYPKNAYCQMMGEYAINVFVRGPVAGVQAFNEFRQWMNAHPGESDGKTDVLGYQIDIKTSSMSKGSDEFLDYHLIVPPNDKQPMHLEVTDKPENVFVLGLVSKGHCDTEAGIMIVHIVGWCWNHDIDVIIGTFGEKFVLKADELRPMEEFPYEVAL